MSEGSVGRIVARLRGERVVGECVGVMKEEGRMRSMYKGHSKVWSTHSDLDLLDLPCDFIHFGQRVGFQLPKGGPV
jgi:hypothetical protein